MNCDTYRQHLLQLDLSADERRATADALRHLETCADCQRAIAQYEQLQSSLKPDEQTPEPPGGWAAFENRLLASVEPRRASWFPQTMRLAAAFLLGILIVEAMRLVPSHSTVPAPPSQNPTIAQATPAFTPQEIAQHAQAFNEVSQVFDRRASWVLLANNANDVGVADGPIADHRKLLLIRLTMTHANEPVATSDLVIIPGQSASLTVPLQSGNSVHYEIGTTTGDSTRLSLWAELQGKGHKQALGALATELQVQPDEKLTAGELVTTSGAYQLKVGFSQAPVASGGKL